MLQSVNFLFKKLVLFNRKTSQSTLNQTLMSYKQRSDWYNEILINIFFTLLKLIRFKLTI